jgi:hypothetical protein
VVDQDDLGGSEESLTDRQRPNLVIGHHAARIADDVCLAFGQAEDSIHVQSGVHAGDDRDVLARRQRQRSGEGLGVRLVVLQVFVGHGHWDLLGGRAMTSTIVTARPEIRGSGSP